MLLGGKRQMFYHCSLNFDGMMELSSQTPDGENAMVGTNPAAGNDTAARDGCSAQERRKPVKYRKRSTSPRKRTPKPATPRTEPLPEFYLTGKGGEEAAQTYLIAKGYTILETNYRVGHREIDLIAQHENRLVFVEVKTRAQNCLVLPQDAVHRLKQWHLLRAAHAYILRSHSRLEARFDIICVKKTPLRTFEVTEHIVNAFRPV